MGVLNHRGLIYKLLVSLCHVKNWEPMILGPQFEEARCWAGSVSSKRSLPQREDGLHPTMPS